MDNNPLQQWIDSAITHSIMDMEKHVAWTEGYTLYKVILDTTEQGWLGILKAHRGKKFVCAFVPTETLGELVEIMAEMTEKGQLQWQTDRFPSKLMQRRVGSI